MPRLFSNMTALLLRRPTRWLALGLTVLVALGLTVAARSYLRALDAELPALADVRRLPLAFPSIIYAADGQELARYFRQNRTWVALEEISPHVTSALLATEDHRFYEHGGIDAVRLAAVAWQALRHRGGRPEGASTLSMQLARNLFTEVGRERSLRRKLKEMRMAQRLEAHYTKDEILALYLNTVPFGMGAFGIEAAAQTYFGKSAATLEVGEAAVLVGLLKGPTRYHPARHALRARHRRDVVLGQMLRHGALSQADYARHLAAPIRLDLHRPARIGSLAPHFAEHVRTQVEAWTEASGYDLYTDGLRIHTTLDAQMQRRAVAALREQTEGLQAVAAYEWSRRRPSFLADTFAPYYRRLESGEASPFAHFWKAHSGLLDQHLRRTSRYRRLAANGVAADSALALLHTDRAFFDSVQSAATRVEAGLAALDPVTGHVKAWVGGRDFGRDQYDKVAMARRQPGSTFKPFVYAAAIEAGWQPEALVNDTTRSRSTWRPRDLPGTAADSLTLRDALAYSKNTAAARLIADVGPDAVAAVARHMGITSRLTPVPSLALGTSEVTLLELTAAYGTFAAGGIYHAPVVVTRIENRTGEPLWTSAPRAYRALSRYTAYDVLDMMRSAIDYGTGVDVRKALGRSLDLAGKTGTSQNAADGWFLLAHPRLVTGVWVGFNDRRLTFRSDEWGRGSRTALPIATDFLRRVQASDKPLPLVRFQAPPGYHADTLRSARPNVALLADSLPMSNAFALGLRRPDVREKAPLDAEEMLRQAARDTARRRVLLPAETFGTSTDEDLEQYRPE